MALSWIRNACSRVIPSIVQGAVSCVVPLVVFASIKFFTAIDQLSPYITIPIFATFGSAVCLTRCLSSYRAHFNVAVTGEHSKLISGTSNLVVAAGASYIFLVLGVTAYAALTKQYPSLPMPDVHSPLFLLSSGGAIFVITTAAGIHGCRSGKALFACRQEYSLSTEEAHVEAEAPTNAYTLHPDGAALESGTSTPTMERSQSAATLTLSWNQQKAEGWGSLYSLGGASVKISDSFIDNNSFKAPTRSKCCGC